jgi:endonuclease YncB( thermonuclease family)
MLSDLPKTMLNTLLLLLLLLLAHGTQATAATPITVNAEVSRVTDGDSLWVALSATGEPLQVRLLGIDAPEICQAGGQQARQELAERVQGRQVTLRTQGQDTYGRTLATVFVDELNINKKMVQEGHAWSTRYKYDRGPFVADERMAKALLRGLHAQGGAVMPKDFRRSHGPCARDANGDAPVVTAATGSAPVATVSATVSTGVPRDVSAGTYRCDGRTRCSQMTSCAEAAFFLRHCPGVKIDGNNDGVPCERQWCTAGLPGR